MPTSYTIPTASTKNQLDGTGKIDRNAGQFLTAPPAPIAASTMQSAQTPYNIPGPSTQPSTSNLSLTNNNVAATTKSDATFELPQNPAKDQLGSLFKDLQTSINDAPAAEAAIQQEQDIYAKKQKATAVSNQLDQMDKEYRDQVNELKKNPGGINESALNSKIADITDRYENNRANVALTYKVLAGDYNDAQQIVNDKVASLDKRNSQNIQLYQLAVDAVNNDLTESEKLQVQANLTKQQNEAKALSDTYTTAITNAVKNGASASVLSAIDDASRAPNATAASILAAAGRYAVDPVEQANLANIYSQIAARNQAANGNATLNGKPQTATQAQVQGYADRTNQADAILTNLGNKFTGVSSYLGQANPFNFLKSSDRQQFEQAQQNFINAILRRESGAAISATEFDRYSKQYFPQPGDAPETVALKTANRQTTINNLYQQANVSRTALPGQIVQDADGTQYLVGDDGETLIPQ